MGIKRMEPKTKPEIDISIFYLKSKIHSNSLSTGFHSVSCCSSNKDHFTDLEGNPSFDFLFFTATGRQPEPNNQQNTNSEVRPTPHCQTFF